MNLLSADQRRRLEGHLDRRLGEVLEAGGLTDPAGAALATALGCFVSGGGKRIRPQLCWWTFAECGGGGGDEDDATLAALLDAACAWEVFHAFLLIHDDIIDAADLRRGQPSLHRALASFDGDSLVFGTNLGIVAGDLLFAAALRLWGSVARHAPDMRRYVEAFDVFSRIALETGVGQAADITQAHADVRHVTEQQILTGYTAKTAAYTFEGPMLTGAILAGADASARGRLARFAASLGQAYQLQNDLLDLASPIGEGSDLAQGKRTLTLIRARALCEDPSAFDAEIGLIGTTVGTGRLEAAERLRQRVFDSGAVEATRRRIEDLVRIARQQTTGDGLPGSLASGLGQLLDTLEAGYFAESA